MYLQVPARGEDYAVQRSRGYRHGVQENRAFPHFNVRNDYLMLVYASFWCIIAIFVCWNMMLLKLVVARCLLDSFIFISNKLKLLSWVRWLLLTAVQQLVVTASGPDRPGIVARLSKRVLDCGGNVEESRMARLAGEFSILMLITFNVT